MTSFLLSSSTESVCQTTDVDDLSASSVPPAGEGGSSSRKRRRPNTKLTRIDLRSAKLSASNESLNSNSSSGISSSLNSDDEFTATPSNEKGRIGGSVSPFGEAPASSSDAEKRPRLRAQSSAPLPSIKVNGTATAEPVYNLAELECASQSGTTSARSSQLASGGSVIGNGEFELVGDGRECKAVNVQTNAVFHCQVMKAEDYKNFLAVLQRLKVAEKLYIGDEFDTLRDLLIPEGTRTIREGNGSCYLLMPDHHGNIHSLVVQNASSAPNASIRIFSERRIQPIFKQIVTLVEFCHRIGLYFRDFRLRKFVFIDKERSKIRLNNVLDLYISPDIDSDKMHQRHVCPAYVAPEILDTRTGAYSGRPADIWALGVLMFILLTGRYPFFEANPNLNALFKRIKARRFSFPVNEYISNNARWLLHGLLRSDPLKRPTASEILCSHWFQADVDSLPDGKINTSVQRKAAVVGPALPPPTITSTAAANANGVARRETAPVFVRMAVTSGHATTMLPLQQATTSSQPTSSVSLSAMMTRSAEHSSNLVAGTLVGGQKSRRSTVADQLVPEVPDLVGAAAAVAIASEGMSPTVQSFAILSNSSSRESGLSSLSSAPPLSS